MCLDFNRLMKYAKEREVNIYLGGKKETNRLITQQKKVHFVTVNDRVIHVETKNGVMTIADGLLTKIYYSFLSPLTLIFAFSQGNNDINSSQETL